MNETLLAILIGVSIFAVTFLVASGSPMPKDYPQGHGAPMRLDILAISGIVIIGLILFSFWLLGNDGHFKGESLYVFGNEKV